MSTKSLAVFVFVLMGTGVFGTGACSSGETTTSTNYDGFGNGSPAGGGGVGGKSQGGAGGETQGGAGGASQGGAGGDSGEGGKGPCAGLCGTLTFNHMTIPLGVTGWVSAFDTKPGRGVGPIASSEVDPDGSFAFPALTIGQYWLWGVFDINRNGVPESQGGGPLDVVRVVGPLEAPASDVEIATLSVTPWVISELSEAGGGGDTTLLALMAWVYDPENGAPLESATVIASDGTNDTTLGWKPSSSQYAAMPAWVPVHGEYTFTTSDAVAYPTPFEVPVMHQPMTERPTITAPTNNQHFGAVQDIEVSWTDVSGTSWNQIAVYDGGAKLYHEENVANPHTILHSQAGFIAGKTYEIRLHTGRRVEDLAIASYERAADSVDIIFD